MVRRLAENAIIPRMTRLIAAFWFLLTAVPAASQPEEWSKPFPGHRVIGNLYAVGTYDLACFLITSNEGHILINSGLAESAPLIRANIEALGFHFEEVRILLTMQAHYDHAAALAEIRKATGAQMWATAGDAPLLEDGGASDPHFQGEYPFAPVPVDRVLEDGEVIALGETRLTVVESPGHTPGSATYTLTVTEDGRDYRVAIANMGSMNPGMRLSKDPTYPGIAADFAETFRRQREMEVDVWVAAHASQYGLHTKYQPGDSYRADTFVDPEGFRRLVAHYERLYEEQLAAERREAAPGGRTVTRTSDRTPAARSSAAGSRRRSPAPASRAGSRPPDS